MLHVAQVLVELLEDRQGGRVDFELEARRCLPEFLDLAPHFVPNFVAPNENGHVYALRPVTAYSYFAGNTLLAEMRWRIHNLPPAMLSVDEL
eukprot:6213146-Pleurochrysis_carterae.AAC.1